MGVNSVMIWKDTGGTAMGQRAYDSLCAGVESLRGASKRRFSASVTVLRPKNVAADKGGEAAAGGSDLWLINFSDKASQSYLVLREAKQAIESERAVAAILGQVNTHHPRVALTMDGQQYQLGDFAVRVGNVLVKASGEHRGTIVQVEYRPSSSLDECAALLQEFTAVLRDATATASGRLEAVDVPLHQFSLPPRFCHQHLAVQYSSLVAHLLTGR